MATPVKAPLVECSIKADLTRQLKDIQTAIAKLWHKEVIALNQGDHAAEEFINRHLQEARDHRTRLMDEYQEHSKQHRC